MTHPDELRGFVLSIASSLLAAILFQLGLYAYRRGIFRKIYTTARLGVSKAQQWGVFVFRALFDVTELLSLQLSRFLRITVRGLHWAINVVYLSLDQSFGTLLKLKPMLLTLLLAIIALHMQQPEVLKPTTRLASAQIDFEPYWSASKEDEKQNKPVYLKKAPPGIWTYRIKRDKNDSSGSLDLFLNNRPVFAIDGGDFLTVMRFTNGGEEDINDPISEETFSGVLETSDITGDGIPELLLLEESAGSDGYRKYSLLSLGDHIEQIYSQDGCHCELRFEDLDKDGICEAIITDLALITDYIGAGIHPTGPSVEIVLNYSSGGFHYATNLMKQPAPLENEVSHEAAKAIAERRLAGRLMDDTYSYILKLVYSGNGELAHRFVHLVFFDAPPNEREFCWYSIYGGVMHTPYRTEIAALNKWALDQYEFKECPE